MSIISPPLAPPASSIPVGVSARPQWSLGRLISRAIVILVGIAVGLFIGVFIGLATGWIEITLC